MHSFFPFLLALRAKALAVLIFGCPIVHCQLAAQELGEPITTVAATTKSPAGHGSLREDLVDDSTIARAIQARDENAALLQSAYGMGSVKMVIQEADADHPVTLLDSDIQFFYQEPQYRVHLVHNQRLIKADPPEDRSDANFERWIPSEVIEQIILFDGEQLVSVEFLRDGTCQGQVSFGFAKMNVMRSAGFPFETPVDLWKPALSLEDLDRRHLSITPLDHGGWIGLMRKNTYSVKFFFLNRFGYDLRRVSSYRRGENQPFRDYLLSWETSNGVQYVQRYTNTVTSAHGNTASSAQTSRRLVIDYQNFEANVDIAPSVFELSSVDIPFGTLFRDNRENVAGNPKQLLFTEAGLVTTE